MPGTNNVFRRSPCPARRSAARGTITRLDGTGWYTLDARAVWPANTAHQVSVGYHRDRYTLASNRYITSDWIAGAAGPLNLASSGKTQADALWAQDAWTILPRLTATLGGRYEWWKAYDGANFSPALLPTPTILQPRLAARRCLAQGGAGLDTGKGLEGVAVLRRGVSLPDRHPNCTRR